MSVSCMCILSRTYGMCMACAQVLSLWFVRAKLLNASWRMMLVATSVVMIVTHPLLEHVHAP